MKENALLSVAVWSALLTTVSGCGGNDTPPAQAQQPPAGTTVNVTLKEWAVVSDTTTVPSGPVTFRVTNSGVVPHEAVILKLNNGVRPETMPVRDGEVDEVVAGIVIGEIEETDLPPQTTRSVTVTLTPGEYALFCAVVENNDVPRGTPTSKTRVSHYLNGMFTKLTVT